MAEHAKERYVRCKRLTAYRCRGQETDEADTSVGQNIDWESEIKWDSQERSP